MTYGHHQDSRPAAPVTSLMDSRLRWTTIGALSMVLLAAFEAMAVTTIMPLVAADLDGQALFSVAFSATLAASIIGMVVAGRWSDAKGPAMPLLTAVGAFLVGLLAAGLATSMEVFIVGRFFQGLGAGAMTVCLYVVVARLYPAALHPRVFGAFAAAWVIPSMIGPLIAGIVAEAISWHWVFLGVAVLVVAALISMTPAIRTLLRHEEATPADVEANPAPVRVNTTLAVSLAVVAAAGLVLLGISHEVVDGPFSWGVAAAAVAVALLAVRPLLPRRTLLAGAGLPATILMRGTIAAAYFGTEVYLPRMLQDSYELSPSMSGLILTVGALSWSSGSAIQARLTVPPQRLLTIGSSLVLAGICVQVATAAFDLGPWVAMAGWLVAGGGMGLAFPRISTLVLAYSSRADQGANSSALSISDSVGASCATAIAGLVFVSLDGVGGSQQYLGGFAVALVAAVATVLVSRRAGRNVPEAAPVWETEQP